MTHFSTIVRIAVVLLCACPLLAQVFDHSWNTLDGGGGTSTGGAFQLAGTIGQPDVQVLLS